jgi:predicted phosphodiesterase
MTGPFLFLQRKGMTVAAGLFILFPLLVSAVSQAGNPHGAYYSAVNNRVFWFVVASDTHIGKKNGQGRANLEWLLTEGREVIEPSFIVLSGDLTDSTNGGLFPNGPWLDEWTTYRTTVDGAGATAEFFFDAAGNHDQYNDGELSFYLNHSVQGRATGQTQASWTRSFPFGTYHFITACTAGNDGAPFSPFPPTYGDNAGLDDGELAFIRNALENNKTADLSLIFGHHPLVKPKFSLKTWYETALTYGLEAFVGLMNQYGVSVYGYGHTHVYQEQFFVRGMREGVIYLNTTALGELENNAYTLMAVDCNGLSVRNQAVRSWPLVLITAPLDANLGTERNPYTYGIPRVDSGNPVRALVFDKNPVLSVEYRVDEQGAWLPMQPVPGNPCIWEADASVTIGDQTHVVEVRATGSSVQTGRIPTGNPPLPEEEEGTGCYLRTLLSR